MTLSDDELADLLVRAKAAPDGPGDHPAKYTADERATLERERAARASTYHIAPKAGGHLSPPAGYPTDPDRYLDPTNFVYPCDTPERTRAAARYWGQADNQQQYTAAEQAIIDARLAAFKDKFGIGQDDAEKKEHTMEQPTATPAVDPGAPTVPEASPATPATPEATSLAVIPATEPLATEPLATASAVATAAIDPVPAAYGTYTYVTGDGAPLQAASAPLGGATTSTFPWPFQTIPAAKAAEPISFAVEDGEVVVRAGETEARFALPTAEPGAKSGARHSKTDTTSVQAIHDHARALGARCSMTGDPDDDDPNDPDGDGDIDVTAAAESAAPEAKDAPAAGCGCCADCTCGPAKEIDVTDAPETPETPEATDELVTLRARVADLEAALAKAVTPETLDAALAATQADLAQAEAEVAAAQAKRDALLDTPVSPLDRPTPADAAPSDLVTRRYAPTGSLTDRYRDRS